MQAFILNRIMIIPAIIVTVFAAIIMVDLATPAQLDDALDTVRSSGFTVFAAGETPTDTPTILVCSSTALANSCDYRADGTDDDVQIRAAINDVRDVDGGSVVLTEGTFDISSSLNLDGDLTIRGQGIAITTLQLANGANTDVFIHDRDTDDFQVFLEYFTINGNKDNNTSGDGIDTTQLGAGVLQDIHIDNVFVQSMPERGIVIDNGWGLVLTSSIVEFCDGTGVEILGGNGKIYGNKFGRNAESTTGRNLWIRGSQWMIYGNQVFSSQANGEIAEGMRISGNRNSIVANDIYNSITEENMLVAGNDNVITGNEFYSGAESSAYGVFLHSSSERNHVIANQFVGTFSTAAFNDDGTDNTVRDNKGFVTENSGTATITDGTTSVTASHALDVTPSIGDCSVTPNDDFGASTNFWADNFNSSTFTINLDVDPTQDVTFGWTCSVY